MHLQAECLTIIVADLTISFDNVIAVAGAANQNLLTKVIEIPRPGSIINFKYKETKIRPSLTDTIFGTITFDSAVGIGTERFLMEYYCYVITKF